MSSNLSCRLKVDCYNIFYVNLTVTSKQKFIIDTKKVKRKSSKHTITEKSSNHREGEQEKKGTKEL